MDVRVSVDRALNDRAAVDRAAVERPYVDRAPVDAVAPLLPVPVPSTRFSIGLSLSLVDAVE